MMNKWMLTTRDVLALAGLQKKSSFLDKTLPIAAGVGAGLVAGFGMTALLLTPSRRNKLSGLLRRRVDAPVAAKKEDVTHSDAPGTEVARRLNQQAPAAHA